MADQQNNQTQIAPNQDNDLSSLLMDKSMDAAQQKAEDSMTETTTPESVAVQNSAPANDNLLDIDLSDALPPASSQETVPVIPPITIPDAPAELPSGEQIVNEDPLQFSLGETSELPLPTHEPVVAGSNEIPSESTSMPTEQRTPEQEIPLTDNSNLDIISLETPVVQPAATVSNNIISEEATPGVSELPVVNLEQSPISTDITVDETPSPVSDFPMEPAVTESIEPAPQATPSPEVTENVQASATIPSMELPTENVDPLIDSLINNEQTQAIAPTALPKSAESVSSDEMAFDLESLTSDIAASLPQASSTTHTVSPFAAAVTSATIPAAIASPEHHSNAKKKAFAMIGAFVLLLGAGGFVFKTMMPEEYSLLANMIGITSAESSMETPVAVVPETIPEEPSEIGEIIEETNSSETEQGETSESATTSPETPAEEQPEETTSLPSITLSQAKNVLSLISQQSKKSLATAIKEENKEATTALHKVYKDASSLLDTLAKSNDISTIANVEKQIADIQKALQQGNIILNVNNTNDAQS